MNQTKASTRKENLNTPYCIRTVSGQYVNVFDPDPDTILIEDIAHALSMQCRFGGHLPVFYSVAQHSICVSNWCDQQNKFTALMHDASEAYLLDLPRPIKREMPCYKKVEDQLMEVIAKKFGFSFPFDSDVKVSDEVALKIEWDYLMIGRGAHHSGSVVPLSQRDAKTLFLSRFGELNPNR